jgi:hypothetical protein
VLDAQPIERVGDRPALNRLFEVVGSGCRAERPLVRDGRRARGV